MKLSLRKKCIRMDIKGNKMKLTIEKREAMRIIGFEKIIFQWRYLQ